MIYDNYCVSLNGIFLTDKDNFIKSVSWGFTLVIKTKIVFG